MSLRKIFKAAFNIKNFALLSSILIIAYLTEYLPFFFIGAAGYIYFVQQTVNSEKFKKECMNEDAIADLERLGRECNLMYRRISSQLDKNAHARLQDVLHEKNELMSFFSKHKEDMIKQKITEQALNLVAAYIKLVCGFCVKKRDLGALDTADIAERLNRTRSKLSYVKDEKAIEELQKAIEMDETLIQKIDDERKELERISARLEYIESAISTFKHKIISKDETDPETAEIEVVINEASALENALSSNERIKVRE